MFRLANRPGEYVLRPKGISIGSEYEVILDNSRQIWRVPGAQLAGAGLVIRLDTANTSELVLYQQAKRAQ